MCASAKDKDLREVPSCPRCGSQDLWRHGKNSAGNRQWLCKSCQRVFVVDPYLPGDIKIIADRMLEQALPVPKIAKILQGYVSRRWLYNRKGELHV